MKRLKLQFLIFFLLFAAAIGFILVNSYRQMAIEERSIWTSTAERVYNQMQAAISDFLNQEDGRSFSEYRYYQAMPGAQATDASLSISPLANLESESGAKGLVGYFQIDPDGSLSTPYLPSEGGSFSQDERQLRQSRESQIETLTRSLKSEVYREAQADHETGAMANNDSLADSKDKQVTAAINQPLRISKGDVKNVYPNPIQEQKLSFSKAKQSFEDKKEYEAKQALESEKSDLAQLSRRVLAPSAAQSKAFEEQTKSPESSLPGLVLGGGKGGRLDELIKGATPSLMIDPFQARLVSEKYLVFYRKIWLNEKLYFQGFIVELGKFFDWAMDQSFANSDLMAFAQAELTLGHEVLARVGPPSAALASPLFERPLGYPLNRFALEILAAGLPKLSARLYLNLLTGLIALLATLGLYLIYRTAASQVRLSQKRQDFVSAVTHELKTPLTSIRMYSEMLEDGWVKDDEKRREYYRHLSKESGRLSSLIDNVLQLARLEKQTYKLQMQTAHPDQDFDAWAAELAKLAEVRNYQLTASHDPGLPEIRYDPDAVQQVLMILLDNSMKFSAEKSLEMHLSKDGDGVLLEWSDRGPGLPAAELNKIFEKFYRVENEMTRKTQGTGIGLAMAKIIVESMSASIEARNREGGGLRFLIRFPAPA